MSPSDVKKAAKEAGQGGSKLVPLTAAEARSAASELASSKFPKVRAIGAILLKVLTGEIVPKVAETDLGVITGERKTAKA